MNEPSTIGSSRDPNAPIHSVEIRIPAQMDEKIAHDYYITKARPVESGRSSESPGTEKRAKSSKSRSKQKERREKRRERNKIETSSSSATSSDLTMDTEKTMVRKEKRRPKKTTRNKV